MKSKCVIYEFTLLNVQSLVAHLTLLIIPFESKYVNNLSRIEPHWAIEDVYNVFISLFNRIQIFAR